MWLSGKGNLKLERKRNNLYHLFRWDEKKGDWVAYGDIKSTDRARRYIRELGMTHYEDVPDNVPDGR